jgi:cephalosporin hydroxylase
LDPIKQFELEREVTVKKLGAKQFRDAGLAFVHAVADSKYTYNFSWMGRPIIQYPQDVFAIQEIIWAMRPDLVIETGIAHGGSLIFHASMLELIGDGEVLGVDIDIRDHNRQAIEQHPMAKRIKMIQGSSVEDAVVKQVWRAAQGKRRILVILDSNHTHEHVMLELQAYQGLVQKGGYLIVMDTTVEDFKPENLHGDRPWGIGNNPKTAVREFLKANDRFEIDQDMNAKLLISATFDGYLRCVK